MTRSTGARTRRPPLRRIPWQALDEEEDAADQVWSALPEHRATLEDVRRFLANEGLRPGELAGDALYAYADGPTEMGSPVQSEWYLEFQFVGDLLSVLAIEKRLVGP
jgi:hypothetical protein